MSNAAFGLFCLLVIGAVAIIIAFAASNGSGNDCHGLGCDSSVSQY